VVIYRSWICLNRNCLYQWTVADLDHPPCPRCAGTKVQWVPATRGIISQGTKHVDTIVKETIKSIGDKNYQSPRMGSRMAPQVNPAPAGPTKKFAPAPGWSIDCPVGADGNINQAFCAPAGITAKVSHGVGHKSQVRADSPSPTGMIPKYEAVHRP
jgi:hypothetical protein